jgi:hypothetical protein
MCLLGVLVACDGDPSAECLDVIEQQLRIAIEAREHPPKRVDCRTSAQLGLDSLECGLIRGSAQLDACSRHDWYGVGTTDEQNLCDVGGDDAYEIFVADVEHEKAQRAMLICLESRRD